VVRQFRFVNGALQVAHQVNGLRRRQSSPRQRGRDQDTGLRERECRRPFLCCSASRTRK